MAEDIGTQVKSRIRMALRRDAELDAERVRVTVEMGKVTLRGVLKTSAEITVAEAAAWGAPGVEVVESYLRSDEDLAAI